MVRISFNVVSNYGMKKILDRILHIIALYFSIEVIHSPCVVL